MASGLLMAARPPQALGFLTPTHVFSGGNGTGNSVTATGSISGDFAIGIVSDNDNSIPDISGMTGVTAIGDGIASDESGNDAAIRCVALFLSSSNQALPAGGLSRIAWTVWRGVATDILTSMPSGASAAGRFAYLATSGSNWLVPAMVPTRAAYVLALGKRAGTTDTRFTNMTELHVQNAASAQAQIFRTAAEVTNFVQDTYAIASTQARAAMTFPLYGAAA